MEFLRKHPFFTLVVVSLLLICGVWSKIVFHPNKYLLASDGDAFKNNYTPAWFVANDHGTRFTGMHYPEGEHVVFTDNQPLISWTLNFVDENIYPIHDYTIGILNILLFVSLFFGILFLYKILVYYKLPEWYAAIIALAIGLFTPQLERFAGHFALGYAVFIPWLWWQMLRVKEQQYKLKSLFGLLLLIFLFGLIHMYYVLIGGLMVGFHAFVLFLQNRKAYKDAGKLLVSGLLPLFFVMTFMHFTDYVNDRPESPYGFFRYKANFQTVFVPREGTLTNYTQKYLNFGQANPEGYAYVGYTGLLFLFIIVFIYIKRLLYKRNFKKSLLPFPGDLGAFLFTGILMLLFSMTLPFSLGLEFLLDIITPLKQFRSPGRFAWVFFYIYLVSVAVLIYLLHQKIKKRYPVIAKIFFIGFTGLLTLEGLSYFSLTGNRLQQFNASNPFDGKNIYFADMLTNTPYKADDFDAILFLPSMFQGSEKIYVDRTLGNNFMKGLELSYQTGLPLVNYMMSRTSLSETLNDVQIVSHPYISNNSKQGVFTLNKLLVMSCAAPKNAGEMFILNNSTKISEKIGYELYAFDMTALKQKGPQIAVADYVSKKDSLESYVSPSGFTYLSEQELKIFFRNGFDDQDGKRVFYGKGALNNKHKATQVGDIPVSTDLPIWIEVSYWAQNDISEVAYPYVSVLFYDGNGNLLREHSVTPTLSTDVMNGWIRASENFEVTPDVKQLKLFTSDNGQAWFDELLVRHTAFNAYYDVASDKNFMVNNFSIAK